MMATTPAGTLVGRENELALLAGLVKQVARGRGRAVLIEGEPGIGKSALVRVAVAAAPAAGCQVFWGAGDELGQELPLLPFLDALRVREPSADPRRNTIVGLLRGEVAADRGADVPAVLAVQVARQLLRAVGGPGGTPAPAGAALVDEWMLGWLDRTAGSLVSRARGSPPSLSPGPWAVLRPVPGATAWPPS